jgi:hypothetical protein
MWGPFAFTGLGTLGLFEEAGIILKPREQIVKRGAFRGKVPKGVKRSIWSGKLRLELTFVKEGELVLTNKRLIAIGKGAYGKVVVYPDLALNTFTAVKETDADLFSLFIGIKHELVLNVRNAAQWARAIRGQCQGEEPGGPRKQRPKRTTEQKSKDGNLRTMEKKDILYWAGKYDEEYPWWAKEEERLRYKFRKTETVTRSDLLRVVDWKFKEVPPRHKRVRELVKANTDEVVQQTCSQVFAMSDDSDRIESLDALHGVGPALASAILAFYDPKQYGVLDIHVWRELFGEEPSTLFIGARCYLQLLSELRRIAGKYDIDARTVEKAYFKKNLDEASSARGLLQN